MKGRQEKKFVNTITFRTMKQVLSSGVRFAALGYYSLLRELTPVCELSVKPIYEPKAHAPRLFQSKGTVNILQQTGCHGIPQKFRWK